MPNCLCRGLCSCLVICVYDSVCLSACLPVCLSAFDCVAVCMVACLSVILSACLRQLFHIYKRRPSCSYLLSPAVSAISLKVIYHGPWMGRLNRHKSIRHNSLRSLSHRRLFQARPSMHRSVLLLQLSDLIVALSSFYRLLLPFYVFVSLSVGDGEIPLRRCSQE